MGMGKVRETKGGTRRGRHGREERKGRRREEKRRGRPNFI